MRIKEISKLIIVLCLLLIVYSCSKREDQNQEKYDLTYIIDGKEYQGRMITLIDTDSQNCNTKAYRIEDQSTSALIEITKTSKTSVTLKIPSNSSCEMGVGLYAFGGVFVANEGSWTINDNKFTLICKVVDIQTQQIKHNIEVTGTLP